jgi:WD40 repeat protein
MLFIRDSAQAFEKSISHLYISALPWISQESHMHKMLKYFHKAMVPCEILQTVKGRSQIGSSFTGHTGSVRSVAFSPDGKQIVSGSSDRTVSLWDAQTGSQIGNPLTGHTSWVNSVAFSPDGKQIVSGSRDKTVRLWDAQTGSQIGNPLTGHTSLVNSVAFSPDGKQIVSGSYDNTVRLWDAQTGSQIGNPLTGQHTDSGSSVAISPDGSQIVQGYVDGTIRVFRQEPTSGTTEWKEYSAQDGSGFLLHHSKGLQCVKPTSIAEDGWIEDDNGNLILWVPYFAREILLETSSLAIRPNGVLVKANEMTLDISNFCYGDRWTEVYTGGDQMESLAGQ